MFTTRAIKAYSSALVAAFVTVIIAYRSAGIDSVETIIIVGGVVLAFIVNYWIGNSKVYDGALVIAEGDPLKDVYSLEIATPLPELKDKPSITLKVTSMTANSQ